MRCAQTNGRIVDDKRDSPLMYVNETNTPARIASQSLARTLKYDDPNGFPDHRNDLVCTTFSYPR